MNTCVTFRTRRVKAAATFCFRTQRWNSYDATSLSWEALTQKVEAGLGEGVDGKPLRIDAKSKTVATASGSLPLSPVLDPAWIKAKRLPRKAPSQKPGGRFRRKLANNPFARALETPIRRCANAKVSLPRYFMQDFEMVQDPEIRSPCWAYGPMTIKFVEQRAPLMGRTHNTDLDILLEYHEEDDEPPPPSPAKLPKKQPQPARPPKSAAAMPQNPRGQNSRVSDTPHKKAPITTYTLCRKSLIDTIGTEHKYVAVLHRGGMARTPETRYVTWRLDTGDSLEELFRRCATDALISRSHGKGTQKHLYVQPCADWDDVEHVTRRGCVLWNPPKGEDNHKQYTTFDIEGAKFGSTMAVHNLPWLLGFQQMRRLVLSAPVFRHELCVLTQEDTIGMMRLHLLLWRLQGFLRPSQA